MIGEKFNLSQLSISSILGLIQAEEFVSPEIRDHSYGNAAR